MRRDICRGIIWNLAASAAAAATTASRDRAHNEELRRVDGDGGGLTDSTLPVQCAAAPLVYNLKLKVSLAQRKEALFKRPAEALGHHEENGEAKIFHMM